MRFAAYNAAKSCECGRGSMHPEHTYWGAYSSLPDPLVGLGGRFESGRGGGSWIRPCREHCNL